MSAFPKFLSRSVAAAAPALALYLAAPGAKAQTVTVTAPESPSEFWPAKLTITPGTEVTWNILGIHDVVQTTGDNCEPLPGGFDSGLAAPPRTFSLVFDEPGTYYYMCTPHCESSNQKGVIIVAEGNPGDGDGDGDGDDEGTGGNEGVGGTVSATGGAEGAGGNASATGGAVGATGGAEGAGGNASAAGGTDPGGPVDPGDGDDDESGCSCRLPGGPVPPTAIGPFALFALLGLALLRRRSARS